VSAPVEGAPLALLAIPAGLEEAPDVLVSIPEVDVLAVEDEGPVPGM
jgi:hypothetical protein